MTTFPKPAGVSCGLLLAALLSFGFLAPAQAWVPDPAKPLYYSIRGELMGDSRLTVNFDTWGSLEMYSTTTVVGKSVNAYAFGVVAPNAWYPQSGHELNYQLIVTTQGYVGIATANPAGLFTVGNGTLTVLSNGLVGVGTTAPAELLSLGAAGTILGVLSLAGNGSGKIIIKPGAAAGTYTLTLPDSAGSANQFLQTDGSGGLSWATGSGMTYPAAGIAVSAVSAWGASLTLDTDGNLAGNSDTNIPSQKAVKTYADTKAAKGANSDITSLSGLTTALSIGQGGTGKTSWTQFLIPYADSANSFSQIPIGTSRQVLTSNGAGVAPSFQAAGGFSGMQVFTVSGTWTKPTGITKVLVRVLGGGGGAGP